METHGLTEGALRRRKIKHHKREDIIKRLLKQADKLFDDRVEVRHMADMLQDVYENATGTGANLYADNLVKEVRGALHDFDHASGDLARTLERLAREIKSGMR